MNHLPTSGQGRGDCLFATHHTGVQKPPSFPLSPVLHAIYWNSKTGCQEARRQSSCWGSESNHAVLRLSPDWANVVLQPCDVQPYFANAAVFGSKLYH